MISCLLLIFYAPIRQDVAFINKEKDEQHEQRIFTRRDTWEYLDKNEGHQFILTEGVTLTVYNNGKNKNNNNENISLAFTVNGVDEEYNRLLEIGISIIDPPKTQPWGAKNMHLVDPDGNHIYFRSFPK